MIYLDSSLSGLQASSAHLVNSANNTANMHSISSIIRGEHSPKPYQPTDIVQSSLEPSNGVRTSSMVRSTAELTVYDPESFMADEDGMVVYPNVSAEDETVQTMLAKQSFFSNLRSLEASLDMTDSLMDIAA